MFSNTVRLHILLILTVLCIAFYIYSIGKEITLFQKDMDDLKQQMNIIMDSLYIGKNQNYETEQINKDTKLSDKQNIETVYINSDQEEELSESTSITSNIIENIITQISQQNIDEIYESQPNNSFKLEIEEIVEPNKESVESVDQIENVNDLTKLSDEELANINYSQLKAFVKKVDGSASGRKNQLLARVKELRT